MASSCLPCSCKALPRLRWSPALSGRRAMAAVQWRTASSEVVYCFNLLSGKSGMYPTSAGCLCHTFRNSTMARSTVIQLCSSDRPNRVRHPYRLPLDICLFGQLAPTRLAARCRPSGRTLLAIVAARDPRPLHPTTALSQTAVGSRSNRVRARFRLPLGITCSRTIVPDSPRRSF